MPTIKEVVLMFAELPEEEKYRCLKILSFQGDSNRQITKFFERHQFVYKVNAKFTRTPPRKGDTMVEITLKTNFGKFTASGESTEKAKLLTVQMAEKEEMETLFEPEKE